jgi:acylphosphatase
MVARLLTIRGRVQGVGYREAMVDAAMAMRVTGWVRNRHDGTVEALVQGDAGNVDRVVSWCRRGPASARVAEVGSREVVADPSLVAFERRATD